MEYVRVKGNSRLLSVHFLADCATEKGTDRFGPETGAWRAFPYP